MKLAPDCYQCLQRLIHQAVDLATDDVSLRQKATEEATQILDSEFSYNQVSIVVAAKVHRVVKKVTGNPDPYRTMKEREMTLARELFPELSKRAEAAIRPQGEKSSTRDEDEFRNCLQLAAAANAIDFFREPDSIKEDIRKPVSFVLDDSGQLQRKLMEADKVLYLADNAGEVYFDLPLVRLMKKSARIVYVVKPEPVQNDLTLEDIRATGLDKEFGEIMSTGTASPGVVLSLASAEFKREFESADLIFAKGMGHYEALSELPAQGKFFYCLRAKCRPVAESLGVSLNSYVAVLQ